MHFEAATSSQVLTIFDTILAWWTSNILNFGNFRYSFWDPKSTKFSKMATHGLRREYFVEKYYKDEEHDTSDMAIEKLLGRHHNIVKQVL